MTALAALSAHGRHHRPPLHRRARRRARLAVLRPLAAIADWRLRRRIEEGRDDAYAAELHEINVDRHTPAPQPPPPVVASGPAPAAVLPDEDVPGPWADDTHAFSRYVDGGQE